MAKNAIQLIPIMALDVGNGYGKVSMLTNWNEEPLYLLPASLAQGMDTTAYVAPDGSIGVYGEGVKHRACRAVRAVKTRLNEAAIYLEENGKKYQVAPDAVYAAVARDMVQLAAEQLAEHKRECVHDVVLTYPASFAHRHDLLARLKKSVESVTLKGHPMKVVHMLSEPAAIAVDYLHYMCHRAKDPVQAAQYTALVYDLGHGTFDAAVVTAYADSEKECELHCQDGDPEVGGKIFDDLLYEELCAQLSRHSGYTPKTAEQIERIRSLASEIKHALSENEMVERDVTTPDQDIPVQVTRARFEQLIAPRLQNTWNIVGKLLEEARKRGIKVDAIVLSGGCSRIPYIARQLEAVLQNSIPVMPYQPSMAVCYGAARYGAARTRPNQKEEQPKLGPEPVPVPVLTQHAERSYGIWLPDDTMHGQIRYMIDSKETLPSWSKTIDITSSATGITKLWLYCSKAYLTGQDTGKSADCNEILRVDLVLPPSTPVHIRLHLDANRSLKLNWQTPDGKEHSQTIFGGDTEGKEQ